VRNKLYLIVEGDGEEVAAPKLVRRILHEYFEYYDDMPIESHNANGKFQLTVTKEGLGIERYLEFARLEPTCAAVLVLVDAEKEDVDCPPRLAKEFAERSRRLGLPFPVAVVVSVCEYESWFLANLGSIAPKYFNGGLPTEYEGNPEEQCSAKGWISRQMPDGKIYKETTHQEKMSFDININKTYEACRSFKRLVDALGELLKAIDENKNIVTPL
jgi:hypothetical protein